MEVPGAIGSVHTHPESMRGSQILNPIIIPAGKPLMSSKVV